jgi:hypothetical protein
MRGRKPLNITDEERKDNIKRQYREGQRRFYRTKYGYLKSKTIYYKKKFYHIPDFRKEFDTISSTEDIEKLYDFVFEYNNQFKKQKQLSEI